MDDARRIAGLAVDPLRRFLSAKLADELVLLASDALLCHRAARAAPARLRRAVRGASDTR